MKQKLYILLFIFIAFQQLSLGQQETYTVTKAPFSSDKYDEYSPVFYRNGIVFTSNRGSGSFVDYSGSTGKSTFDITYIDTTKKVTWRKTETFSNSLKTPFNEGTATFSRGGDTVYFTRNLHVDGSLKELSNPGNKLGIFSAIREGDKWTRITEFRFNNEYYNMTTPYLSPDGSRLYFSSDRPGGYGGSDIYYSQMKNGFWEDPINIGPVINTKGNESYPFINEAGELFFSSDGHVGLGGKDIFITRRKNGSWYQPVRLDAPINSSFDDFGIVTDPLMDEGYFSSGRGKTVDIYRFKSNFFQFLISDPQKDNQFCISITDTGSIEIDTLRLDYMWDFGDESINNGTSTTHCFPGPGTYTINLNVIDRKTGRFFFRKLSYNIEISNIEQPFINCPEVAVAGESLTLDGLQSYCPGYSIEGYYWDFGDGTKNIGEKVIHKFNRSGEFDIRLGLILKSEASGNFVRRTVTKKVLVFQSEREKSAFLKGSMLNRQGFPEISEIKNIKTKGFYSAEDDLSRDAMFQVVILSSKNKLALTNAIFRRVPVKYTIKEYFSPEEGMYSYIIDQQMSLMDCYPAYSELISLGLSDTKVRTYILREPAEKELYLIRKNYSMLTDNQFDSSNRLTTSAYIMLDQVVQLMTKYPLIKLEVGVHTDNQGIPSSNLLLSQLRAQVIANYLINRGIGSKRLTVNGYGGARPVVTNNYPTERRLNRRIEFAIL